MSLRIAPRTVAFACSLAVAGGLAPPADATDEIIVTARKREELLQEVPLSLSVFSEDDLRVRNIQTVFDIATFTPNFSFNRNSVGRRLDAPSIRGQFTPLQNFGSEGNVAFYVDGVYVSGTASSLTTDNVARVEIIKGPQAALFGRAAFAGAVNYITRQPTSEFMGEVNLKAGEDSDYKFNGWLSGPVMGDKLKFVVSAGYETVDGEWQNSLVPCNPPTTPGADCVSFRPGFDTFGSWAPDNPPSTRQSDFTDLGGESAWNVTGRLQWEVTERLTVTGKAEYTETDDEHFASLFQPNLNCQLVPGRPGWYCGRFRPDGLVAQMNIADLRMGAVSSTLVNGQPVTAAPAPFIGTRTETTRYLAEAVLALDGWDLLARASFNDQELESYRDLDRSPFLGPIYANVFAAGELQKWEDESFELRATSAQDERLRATLGTYYFSADQESYQREFTGFCNRVAFGLPFINGAPSWVIRAEKRNTAFFGGLDYDFTDTVTLAVEARYAKDTPEQHAANGVNAKTNYYSLTPRATLSWQARDDINLYALAAKGNKPGGFFFGFFDAPVRPEATQAALANGDAIIREEEAWTYEIGAKTQWLDRRLTANIAVYYIDWKNQAINEIAFVPWDCADTATAANIQQNFIRNAGKSEVVGGEIELSLRITEELTVSLNYGLADTELKEYFSLVLEELTGNGDASGRAAPRVPKHSLAASGLYVRSFGDRGAEWFLRADYVWNSKAYTDVDNQNWVGPLSLLNTRAGIQNERWTAAIYVDNVTSDDTPLLASEFPNFADFPFGVTSAFHLVPRRGRNAGLNLQYRF